jgi:hypothetical protein
MSSSWRWAGEETQQVLNGIARDLVHADLALTRTRAFTFVCVVKLVMPGVAAGLIALALVRIYREDLGLPLNRWSTWPTLLLLRSQ